MHRTPLLLPVAALTLGVWTADHLVVDALQALAGAGLLVALGHGSRSRAAGLAAVALIGAAVSAAGCPRAAGPWQIHDVPVAIRGTIQGPPQLRTDGSWTAAVALEPRGSGSLVLTSDRSPPPPPGSAVRTTVRLSEVRNRHVPGQPDRLRRARRTGESITARPIDPLHIEPAEPSPLVRLRRAIRAFFVERLEPPVDGLALALVLGDRSRLDPDLRERFARSGTSHLLAISGLHVGIVALAAGWSARGAASRLKPLRLRVPPHLVGLACGVAAAAVYGSLTGWSVSTRRAGIMAAVLASALALRRRVHPLQLCAAAWGALLLGDPSALWEVGTALSFGSVVALIRLTPRWAGRPLTSLAVASAAVAVGTAPITWSCFGQVSLGSVPCNLLAIPVFGMALVPLLLLAAGLGLAWPTAGSAVLAAADVVARAGCEVIATGAEFSPVLGAWPTVGLAATAVTAMALALALPRLGQRWPAAVLAAALTLLPVHPATPPDGQMTLTVLDVGHGDTLLVSLPDGRHLLVDAGERYGSFDTGERLVVPALRRMGVERLTAIAVTHLHSDHHGGVPAVLRAFPTDELWLPVWIPPDHAAADVMFEALRGGVRPRIVSDGDALELPSVDLQTLHPRPGRSCASATRYCPTNDHSLVLRLTHGQVSFLLTGDAEADLERRLIRDGDRLRSQVLKVPHHGSATSSTAPFVGAVRPLLAVASLDPRHRHRLPRASVVSRYRAHGARLLTTGRHGTVQITTDGLEVKHRTFRVPGGWSRWETAPYPTVPDH
jgi:competence protein ComEC